ncbi:putative fatty acyl-CoA reductase CG5065 [Hylaeus volcanicus]|uniref:putative fatty acyl-CoA reductase CG5065 n=1 Tax=Hylaeus volcanicus TaxID=313075 RepID=UPI0023B7AA19|nr:putative fatty acyl-CoA reductase CG5065 [Hylaeus volcanicus]
MGSDTPSISEWFHGRNIFVTGGTGFMGKVLIYKLLLSCQSLSNVFVLVRKKKDMDPQTRLQLMIQQEPFKTLKEKHPERLKKLILVSGDTTAKDLGLSAADKERLLQDVSVVIHMAANVKFHLTLKEAILINTLGTMNVVNLVKQMSRLDSFVHVSTCYSQCTEPVLEERYYPCPVQPEVLIDTVRNLPDDLLLAMTPKMLRGQPNTYAFSKALSEDLVQRCGLPAAITRPSIVGASWKEPAPGWIENMNGPTGLMIGAGKGVIRSLLCNYDYDLHLIPCDLAINSIIAVARKVGMERPEKPLYVNMTVDTENSISWGLAVDTGKKHAVTYPFTGNLWYPGGSLTTLKLYHWVRVVLFHFLPAYVLDAIIGLTGNKPFLVRVQHKISAGMELLRYYTTTRWEFRNDRVRELCLELNPSDREEFFMDTRMYSWDEYLCRYMLGIRKYCLKDDPSTIPRARKVIRYLYYADWFVKIALVVLFMWFIYSYIRPHRELNATSFDVNEL